MGGRGIVKFTVREANQGRIRSASLKLSLYINAQMEKNPSW
jgi:hypothetical protein